MKTLHQIMSSDLAAVRDYQVFTRPGDLLLLVDSGVDLLTNEQCVRKLMELAGIGCVRALRPDVEARGLLNHAEAVSVPLLTDAEWVAATRVHNPILSWK